MNKNIIKFSKIFIIFLFFVMIHGNCQRSKEEIPILPGASNIIIKKQNTYYKRYLSGNDIKEEIKKIEKNMKGWEKANITECDFKYFLFQKMQNTEIKSFLMYNMSWQKSKYFSLFHIEKELCQKKPELNIIQILYENEYSDFAQTNIVPDQIEFTHKDSIKDLVLTKCYAGDTTYKQDNKNIIEYFRWKSNMKCSPKLNYKDIEHVILKKTHFNEDYLLILYINKQKIQLLNDSDPSAFLFLLNKDHILSYVKVKDITIENNRIEFGIHNKNIVAVFDSHFLYSDTCCHEMEVASTEINEIK